MKKKVCKECQFDKELEREPIILDNNELSISLWLKNRCQTCGFQKDGKNIKNESNINASI